MTGSVQKFRKKTSKETTDLLERLQESCPEAQTLLWRTERPRLFHIALSILKSKTEAEVLVDEVLCDFIFHYVTTLNNSNAIRAYLKTMTVRRACRLRDRLNRQSEMDDEMMMTPDTGLEESFDQPLMQRWLKNCYRRLTTKARTILKLRYGHDLSYQEIGQQIGRTKQAVGTSVLKSHKVLQKCLEKKRQEAARRNGHVV